MKQIHTMFASVVGNNLIVPYIFYSCTYITTFMLHTFCKCAITQVKNKFATSQSEEFVNAILLL